VDAEGVYFTSTRGDGVGSVGFLPKELTSGGAPWAFGTLVSWDHASRPGDVKAGSAGAITWVEPESGVVAAIGKAGVRVELASGLDRPAHLAFDGQSMYVGTRSGLMRLDTVPPTLVVPGEMTGLTSDPATGAVFALTRDTAYRIERGQRPSVLLASFPAEIDDVAVNGIELYFVHGSVASVGAFPIGGGPTSPSMTTGGKGPGRIAADESGVYWAAGGIIARATSVH